MILDLKFLIKSILLFYIHYYRLVCKHMNYQNRYNNIYILKDKPNYLVFCVNYINSLN